MRRYNYKRRYPVKKRYYKKGASAGITALKEVRKIKKNIEVKQIYGQNLATLNASNPGQTWSVPVPLVSVSQGSGPTQRIGDKVTAKSIAMKGVFEMDHATPDTAYGNVLRVMLFIDRRPTGTNLTGMETVLTQIDANPIAIDALLNNEPENKGRYQILLDKFLTVKDNVSQIPFQYYKAKTLAMEMTGGATNQVRKNQIYFAFASQRFNSATDTTYCSFRFIRRIMFTDA